MAVAVNKVILVGNIGKDPVIRALESGIKVAIFSLATTESFKNRNDEWEDRTEWHNIVLWRHLAERAEKYLTKGLKVYIEGKLQTRSYEKDGVTKYTTEIVGNQLIMLNKNEDNPKPKEEKEKVFTQDESGDVVEEELDDLPF